jgi:CRISPR-associated protein Cas1
MASHALPNCPGLFYLEELEEIRVADAAVFSGRELHAGFEADEDGELVSLELSRQPLGLIGKIDCLRRRDGRYLPYNRKHGQLQRGGIQGAWKRI